MAGPAMWPELAMGLALATWLGLAIWPAGVITASPPYGASADIRIRW